MIENPWRVEELARMNRERIRDDMAQIRLEQEALEGRFQGRMALERAARLVQPVLTLIGWLRGLRMESRPAPKLQASQHARL